MTKRVIVALATSAVVVIASATVLADSWPGPRPHVFASAFGTYGFKMQPPPLTTWSGKGQGTLYTLIPDGKENVKWSRELVNIPVRAFLADDGKSVVTFDTWARLGYEHALVIYGEQGNVVADYDLEALLSADDIGKVPHTVGSRHWLQGATIAFNEEWNAIVITFQQGKAIRVALSTGTITRTP